MATKVHVRFNDLLLVGRWEAWVPGEAIFIGIGETAEEAVGELYRQSVAWVHQRHGMPTPVEERADIEWEEVDFGVNMGAMILDGIKREGSRGVIRVQREVSI